MPRVSCSGLSCWLHKPQKVYTFSSIVGNIIPKSVTCIHSATKGLGYMSCKLAAGHKFFIVNVIVIYVLLS